MILNTGISVTGWYTLDYYNSKRDRHSYSSNTSNYISATMNKDDYLYCSLKPNILNSTFYNTVANKNGVIISVPSFIAFQAPSDGFRVNYFIDYVWVDNNVDLAALPANILKLTDDGKIIDKTGKIWVEDSDTGLWVESEEPPVFVVPDGVTGEPFTDDIIRGSDGNFYDRNGLQTNNPLVKIPLGGLPAGVYANDYTSDGNILGSDGNVYDKNTGELKTYLPDGVNLIHKNSSGNNVGSDGNVYDSLTGDLISRITPDGVDIIGLDEQGNYIGSDGKTYDGSGNEVHYCNGVDISHLIQPTNNRFYLELLGKDYYGNDKTFKTLVEFSDSEQEAGYKDVIITTPFVGVSNIRVYNPDGQTNGNGVLTIQGKYVNLLDIGLDTLGVALDCVGVAGNPLAILSCISSAFGLVSDIFSSLRNIGTVTMDACSKYGNFIPDLDFASSSAVYTDDSVHITNWLYPVIRIYSSAGFEPLLTDEDWCCPRYDITQKTGGNGKITIVEPPVEPEQPEPEEKEKLDISCICEGLELIANKLDGLTLAIENLELSPVINVEPAEPEIIVSPEITVEPCEPQVVVTPEINVEPCEPIISVQPANPTVQVNNQIDFTGIEAVLGQIKIAIQEITFNGDVDVDFSDLISKIDDLIESFKQKADSQKESTDDISNAVRESSPYIVIEDNMRAETVSNRRTYNSVSNDNYDYR